MCCYKIFVCKMKVSKQTYGDKLGTLRVFVIQITLLKCGLSNLNMAKVSMIMITYYLQKHLIVNKPYR